MKENAGQRWINTIMKENTIIFSSKSRKAKPTQLCSLASEETHSS
jgi:hypothetical protein